MGLYKRGKTWWMSYTDRGRRYRVSTGQATKKKATEVWARTNVSLIDGTYLPERKRPSVLDAPSFELSVESYLDQRDREGKRDRSYIYLRGLWSEKFSGRLIDEITCPEVEVILREEQARRNWSNASRNIALCQLSGLFTYGIAKHWLDRHPIRGRLGLLPVNNGRARWLRRHEIEAIKGQAPNDQLKRRLLCDGLDFLCTTGVRKSVVFDLRKANYEIDEVGNAYVVVERDKNGGRFYKRLVGRTREIVDRRVLAAPFPQSYLFAGPNGGHGESTFIRLFRVAVRASGLEWGRYKVVEEERVPNPNGITIHTCRHTVASSAINAGISEAEVQAMGNWKSRRMVARYGHLAPENLQRAEEQIDSVLNRFAPPESDGETKSVPAQ